MSGEAMEPLSGSLPGMQAMDIVIQHEKTKLFLAPDAKWVAKRKKAVVFANTVSALQHCLHHDLREVVLLCCYRNSTMDFAIAPFSDVAPAETSTFSTVCDAVYYQAKNLELKLENRHLRKELDSIIAEGKERRKRRAFLSSLGNLTTAPPAETDASPLRPSVPPTKPKPRFGQ
jgi:hypothetical protein